MKLYIVPLAVCLSHGLARMAIYKCLRCIGAKTLTAIDPDSMLQALERFGFPGELLQIINAVCSNEKFIVREAVSEKNVSIPLGYAVVVCCGFSFSSSS